jgi:hypothetical protein
MSSGDDAPVGDREPRVALEYASAGEGRRVGWRGLRWLLGMTGACGLLTLVSIWVIYSNADAEPYYGTIRAFDMLQQVGLGSVLIVLWAAWGAGLLVLVGRGTLHPSVLGALLWGALVVLYLTLAVGGYVSDVTRFQTTPSLQQGWQRPGGGGSSAAGGATSRPR